MLQSQKGREPLTVYMINMTHTLIGRNVQLLLLSLDGRDKKGKLCSLYADIRLCIHVESVIALWKVMNTF